MTTCGEVLHLFEGYGLELEYMIVLKDSLDVLPVSDELLRAVAGEYVNDYDGGTIGLSNEFVLHVLELRNSLPSPDLGSLEIPFNLEVSRLNEMLVMHNCVLMPGSMHPWMVPENEVRLWPHANRVIYNTYDRIFNCKRHGWGNIQSMQLNLPFCGDEEFGRLHSAIRLILPLIPSIAASSPFQEGRSSGFLDARIVHYIDNQRIVPSICGLAVPEPVYSRSDYDKFILDPMYRDIAPLDPEGILRHEWLNSRGAIARFERSAIEIRLPDIQEFPGADIAIASLIAATASNLVYERWSSFDEQKSFDTSRLRDVLDDSLKSAEETAIKDGAYLKAFGIDGGHASAKEVWSHLLDQGVTSGHIKDGVIRDRLMWLLSNGTLSRRIIKAAGNDTSHGKLYDIYNELCLCLAEGRFFDV
ncbi:MAG: glutamate--cysteine ligase [Nitrospirota bacterium]|nr:MAG: glutamate--cysteine ligase [Nitrospirota bacterium]